MPSGMMRRRRIRRKNRPAPSMIGDGLSALVGFLDLRDCDANFVVDD